MYYILDGETFENKADMLEFAMKYKKVTSEEVFAEFYRVSVNDTVQAALDCKQINRVCKSLLDYEEVRESG